MKKLSKTDDEVEALPNHARIVVKITIRQNLTKKLKKNKKSSLVSYNCCEESHMIVQNKRLIKKVKNKNPKKMKPKRSELDYGCVAEIFVANSIGDSWLIQLEIHGLEQCKLSYDTRQELL